MFHIHRWTKWSEPRNAVATQGFRGKVIHYSIDAQERTCEKCGLHETRVA